MRCIDMRLNLVLISAYFGLILGDQDQLVRCGATHDREAV